MKAWLLYLLIAKYFLGLTNGSLLVWTPIKQVYFFFRSGSMQFIQISILDGYLFLFSLEILFTVNSLVWRYRDKRELGSFPPHLPFIPLTKSVFTNISKVFGGKKWNLLRSLSGLICLFLGICKFLFGFLSDPSVT